MSNGMKLLLLAAAAIVTCIVVGVGFFVTKEGKNTVNSATGQFSNMTSEYGAVNLSMYDGMTISGAEAVHVLNTYGSQVTVIINTLAKGTIVGSYDSSTKNISDKEYINPNGTFLGSVNRNQNDVIENIIFTQK